jgi:hypothetical protein
MIKHLEIKTYEYCGIRVTVKIDYNDSTISLVERELDNYVKKKWVFINRGIEFMGSWLNILDAMKYAIEEARKELRVYKEAKIKEKNDNVYEALDMATDLIKNNMIKDAKKFIDKKINAKGNRNRKS